MLYFSLILMIVFILGAVIYLAFLAENRYRAANKDIVEMRKHILRQGAEMCGMDSRIRSNENDINHLKIRPCKLPTRTRKKAVKKD